MRAGTGTFLSGVGASSSQIALYSQSSAKSIHYASVAALLGARSQFYRLRPGLPPLRRLDRCRPPDGTLVQTLNGGTGVAKSVPEIGDGATILVPNISSGLLHDALGFIYGSGPHGHLVQS